MVRLLIISEAKTLILEFQGLSIGWFLAPLSVFLQKQIVRRHPPNGVDFATCRVFFSILFSLSALVSRFVWLLNAQRLHIDSHFDYFSKALGVLENS